MKKNILVLSSTLGYDDIRIMKQVNSLKKKYRVNLIGRSDSVLSSNSYEKDGINVHIVKNHLTTVEVKEFIKIKNSIIFEKTHPFIHFLYSFIEIFSIKFKINYFIRIFNSFFQSQRFEFDIKEYIDQNELVFDLVHCHDLHCLSSGSRIARDQKISLIYDSHEFESHISRNVSTIKNYFINRWVEIQEKYLLKDTAYVITVSKKIGQLINEKYNPKSIVYIYNSPSKINQKIKRNIRNDLQLNEIAPLVIYVGKFSMSRDHGHKLIIDMLKMDNNIHFAVLGPRDKMEDNNILNIVKKNKIENRFHLVPPVDVSELVSYITGATVGVILFETKYLTSKYCLPNKFFEMAFANLPFIYRTGLDEINRISNEYNIGYELVDFDGKGLLSAVNEVKEKRCEYQLSEKDLKEFISQYSWDQQEKKLFDLYREIL